MGGMEGIVVKTGGVANGSMKYIPAGQKAIPRRRQVHICEKSG